MPIEPSQARYRSAVAFQRLANALGIELLPTDDDCVCLERLAMQAERLTGYFQMVGRTLRQPASKEEIPDERTAEDWKNHAE